MAKASFLKCKVFGLLLSVIIVLLYFPLDGQSAGFNVTNEDELRDALSTSESNGEDDVINIAMGLYHTGGATFTYESSEDFSLTIQGAGAGLTILDGGSMDRVLEINSESDSDALISISGLTIQNGFHESIPGDMSNPNGAGILIESRNLTIEDCEFNDNSVARAGAGGGLYAIAQNTDLSGNLFTGNSSAFSGGGAYINGNNLEISDNSFIQNFAGTAGGGLSAGGESTLLLIKNSFIDNNSEEFGGGASTGGSSLEIVGNTFSSNSTNYDGGGLRVTAETLTMKNNEFYYNSSRVESRPHPSPFASAPILTEGGGVYISCCIFEFGSITNNIFYGNTSAGNGGGFGIKFITVSLTTDVALVFTNNTFAFNEAGIDGGGVSIFTEQFGGDVLPPPPPPEVVITFDIYNNIVYDNFAGNRGQDLFIRNIPFLGFDFDFVVNLFNNDIDNIFSFCESSNPDCQPSMNEGNNINEDPLFVNLEAGNVSLQPDSPCINAGDPNAPDVPDTDIFGNPRVPPPDMGAVEFIQMVVDGGGGGGCSIASTPVTSSLAVFLTLPVLILIRRITRRQ